MGRSGSSTQVGCGEDSSAAPSSTGREQEAFESQPQFGRNNEGSESRVQFERTPETALSAVLLRALIEERERRVSAMRQAVEVMDELLARIEAIENKLRLNDHAKSVCDDHHDLIFFSRRSGNQFTEAPRFQSLHRLQEKTVN